MSIQPYITSSSSLEFQFERMGAESTINSAPSGRRATVLANQFRVVKSGLHRWGLSPPFLASKDIGVLPLEPHTNCRGRTHILSSSLLSFSFFTHLEIFILAFHYLLCCCWYCGENWVEKRESGGYKEYKKNKRINYRDRRGSKKKVFPFLFPKGLRKSKK